MYIFFRNFYYQSIMIKTDVLIIGAGAVGCALARELSKYNLKVTVCDKNDDVGGDVSLNMAFEFDDFMQFVAFTNEFESCENNDPSKLARQLADCIVPDFSITQYKLTINKKNIDVWLKLMIGSQLNKGSDLTHLKLKLSIITDSNEKNLYWEHLTSDKVLYSIL